MEYTDYYGRNVYVDSIYKVGVSVQSSKTW